MTPSFEQDPQDDERGDAQGRKRKRKNRTHTPRPDELSHEVFEFIAAVDDYKRRHLRSFLEDREVLQIVFDLGYVRDGCRAEVTDAQLADFVAARKRYREEEGRLFPTWSELFELLTGLGYERVRKDPAA